MRMTITLDQREMLAALKLYVQSKGFDVLVCSINASTEQDDRGGGSTTHVSAVFNVESPNPLAGKIKVKP